MNYSYLVLSVLVVACSLGAYPPSGTFHDIAVDFQATFSVLDNLNFTCTVDVSGSVTTDLSGVYTVLNEMNRNFCSPIFITQADVGTTGFTINARGVYKLGENIIFSPGGGASAITISADNVVLDLQCFSISQGNATSLVNGIVVSPNTSQITIKNGLIQNFTMAGILAGDSDDDITIDGVKFIANDRCIFFDGSSTNEITNAVIRNVDFRSSPTGIEFDHVDNSLVKGVIGFDSASAALVINNSAGNSFEEMVINGVSSTDRSVYGVQLSSGSNNSIKNSQIANITSSSSEERDVAAGISMNVTESQGKLLNNTISNVSISGQASAYGIEQEFTVNGVINRFNREWGNQQPTLDVAWHPTGQYFAAATTASPEIAVMSWDGSDIALVSFVSTGAIDAQCLAWSPDGRYLAVGLSDNTTLAVYEFTGSNLISVTSIVVGGFPNNISWSPNGTFIAITVGSSLSVYQVDTQTPFISLSESLALGDTAQGVEWSRDGKFIAVTTFSSTRVYTFISVEAGGSTNLTLAGSIATPFVSEDCAWSFDNQFIAVASNGSPNVSVYRYTNATLTLVDTFDNAGASAHQVSWSQDNNYLAYIDETGAASGPANIRILSFFNDTLVQVGSTLSFGSQTGESLDWSPDGRYIAYGNNSSGTIGSVGTYGVAEALLFPAGYTIRNNLVTDIRGPALGASFSSTPAVSNGVGIKASSRDNLLAGNTAFDNDRNYGFVAFERYKEFLTNIALRNSFPNKLSNTEFPPL